MNEMHTSRLAKLAGHLASGPAEAASGLAPSPTSAAGPTFKVAVLGAAGGIGQPLALLLKSHPLVGELALYDIVGTEGVAADLSHMDTNVKVTSHTGPEKLSAALYGAALVLIPAGVPRKPGMTRDDLFNINAGIVKALCEGVARFCPKALVAVISNPVNSTVPIAAEVFKRAGTYDPRRLLGVTKLDVLRANTFVAEAAGLSPEGIAVPVVGGHAGVTILPLLSQVRPRLDLSAEKIKALTARIQDAGTEVVKAKAGKGSATLSMAYAAARFGESCLRALAGEAGVVECAYVASPLTDLPFFASPVRLGRDGVEEVLPLPRLSSAEAAGLRALEGELRASIQKGIDFVASKEGSKGGGGGDSSKGGAVGKKQQQQGQQQQQQQQHEQQGQQQGQQQGRQGPQGGRRSPSGGGGAFGGPAGGVDDVGTGSSSQLGARVMTNPVAAAAVDTQEEGYDLFSDKKPGGSAPAKQQAGQETGAGQGGSKAGSSGEGDAEKDNSAGRSDATEGGPGEGAGARTGQLYSLQGAQRVSAGTEKGAEEVTKPGETPKAAADTTGGLYAPSSRQR